MSQQENATRAASDPSVASPVLPATLRLGPVHFTVTDLDRSVAFYEYAIGLRLHRRTDPVAGMGVGAFVAAGGYHHLGFNVWRGEGVPPLPEGRVGLRHWTVVLEDPGEVAAVRERVLAAGIESKEGVVGGAGGFLVRDPWDIAVRFATPGGPSG